MIENIHRITSSCNVKLFFFTRYTQFCKKTFNDPLSFQCIKPWDPKEWFMPKENRHGHLHLLEIIYMSVSNPSQWLYTVGLVVLWQGLNLNRSWNEIFISDHTITTCIYTVCGSYSLACFAMTQPRSTDDRIWSRLHCNYW